MDHRIGPSKKRFTQATLTFLSVFVFFVPLIVSAEAQLSISPSDESHNVGEIFSLTIRVTSLRQAINAAQGVISYDRDKLELINISKAGSIFSVWLEGPTYSNENGVVTFAGGIPNPGFIGADGKVFTMSFRAVADGPAALVWKESEVLANDGKGTNILDATSNGNILVLAQPAFARPPEKEFPTQLFLLFAVICAVVILSYLITAVRFTRKIAFTGMEHVRYDVGLAFDAATKDILDLHSDDAARIAESLKSMKQSLESEITQMEKRI